MFEGAHTALVTPFSDNGDLDTNSLTALVEAQVAGGVNGLVPVGTTGESPTLDHDEDRQVIEATVSAANKRCKVIAGAGSNSTREAVKLSLQAEKAGADALLLVTPYYNKPSQEGLFQHYQAIAETTALPIVLYSIPGRCHIAIDVDTAGRLHAKYPNICAIKEAGGSPERVSELRANLPDTFEILSGDDALVLPFISVGAVGVISVASNLIPRAMSTMVAAALAGRWADAQAIHAKYQPLFSAFLKLDTNPAPIKAAMHLAGHVGPRLRLPMVPMVDAKVATLRALLNDLELMPSN
jgi:4-hydroxy-tetrahydrodipicolinate synthase